MMSYKLCNLCSIFTFTIPVYLYEKLISIYEVHALVILFKLITITTNYKSI